MTRSLFYLALLTSAASVGAVTEEPPTVVVLFGDSITAGYNVDFAPNTNIGLGSTTEGQPTVELNVLMQGPPVRNVVVTNYGWGGTPSGPSLVLDPTNPPSGDASGVARIASVLSKTKDNYPGSDYIILILYGTNDIGYRLSSGSTGFNIRSIIRRSREQGFTAIVGTIPPRETQSVLDRNNQIISNANIEGAPVVDIYSRFVSQSGGWRTLIDEEVSRFGVTLRLHPNLLGYGVIVQEWFEQELAARIAPVPGQPPIVVPGTTIIAPIIYLLLED